MTEETPIEVSAQKLINTKLSLSEILGNNWKDNCIFSSVEAALKDEGIKSLDEGEEILPSEATTDLERFVVEANAMFDEKNSPYHAKLIPSRRTTDQEGCQKVLIVGKIGKDTFYQIAQYAITFTHESGERVIAWIPDNFGLISQKTGSVFRFDCLPPFKTKHNSQEVMFMEIAGRKHHANFMNIKTFQNETGEMFQERLTLTFLPENFSQMGTFLHELGHMLRYNAIYNNPELRNGSDEAYNQYQNILKSGLPYNPIAAISPYQTRKINANEERGAWAIGISLIREVGKIIGLDCASSEAVKEMLKREEYALSFYDQLPYTLKGHPEGRPIPAFSSSKKREANALHREIKNNGLNYSSLPSFDSETGENLANRPRKLLEVLAKLKKNSSDSQKE